MNKAATSVTGKISTIVSAIICVILIPIIILNTMMIVKTYTEPDHLPDVLGISPVVVLSGSMSPTFNTSSLIFIQDADYENLEVGDIICFLQSGTAVTHRIVDIVTEDGQLSYVTQGDANNAVDRLPVTPDQIEGVYISHVEGLGGAVMFMQTTTGMIIFVVAPVVLYLIFDILKRRKESSADRSRTAELEEELAKLRAEKDTADK